MQSPIRKRTPAPALILGLLLGTFLWACHTAPQNPREVERAFYYWKSNFRVSDFEAEQLDKLGVQTLYIKYFDVDWNHRFGEAVPVAQIRLNKDSLLFHKNIIPTVFITLEAIRNIDSSQVQSLAQNILELIDGINTINAIDSVQEIQIDCDWTQSTRDVYFSVLEEMKNLKPEMRFSATLRLHQIKYVSATGVPPVDRGLLMCYNMGNLKNPAVQNSILDPAELMKYIGELDEYPLTLDIGLPLFNWKLWFRADRFLGILGNVPEMENDTSIFSKQGNRYSIKKDTLLGGYDFRQADQIRIEESNYADILEVEDMLDSKLKEQNINLILFHLDSAILKKYTYEELEIIFNRLR